MKKAVDNEKRNAELPHGRGGANLKIDLPFEEAIRAALETPPPITSARGKRRRPKPEEDQASPDEDRRARRLR